jgi:chorismate synthase
MAMLQKFLARRAPGNNEFSTSRKEPDLAIVKSGLHDGVTFGAPLTIIIENKDAKSSDYSKFKNIPRPAHADYTARVKYGNSVSMAGGGPFSGRMTAPLCIAGAIAMQALEKRGIKIGAHIFSVADIKDEPFDAVSVTKETLAALEQKNFPVISESAGRLMQEAILFSRDAGDSLGGILECCALGVPVGIGGAMYDGVESFLSPIFFGIPAVKGVEFGAGFGASRLKGSENNDEFYFADDKSVKTKTNNHGGILGGITSGMPIIARLAFKPTPSISLEQNSVNLETGENTKLSIEGRHDPCVVLRAVPVAIAAMAVGIFDLVLCSE